MQYSLSCQGVDIVKSNSLNWSLFQRHYIILQSSQHSLVSRICRTAEFANLRMVPIYPSHDLLPRMSYPGRFIWHNLSHSQQRTFPLGRRFLTRSFKPYSPSIGFVSKKEWILNLLSSSICKNTFRRFSSTSLFGLSPFNSFSEGL